MWGLTHKLAVSNLLKNRELYYPFALMTVLSSAVAYIFTSLTYNPDIKKVAFSSAVNSIMGFGLVVVLVTVSLMILYANAFVMKQRSKEFGLYSVLGLDKKHLLYMNGVETFLFGSMATGLGILTGILLDNLFYAILLRIIQVPVVFSSTFQWKSVVTVLLAFAVIFSFTSLLNAGKIGFSSSLNLVKGKRTGEKKGRFLKLQTLIGTLVLGAAYWLATDISNPSTAISNFFIAVLMVIFATYLLFNAGTIVFLRFLKNRPSYFYQPSNFISVSNLIFRMRKNAMGLATIAILSTMVLVTLIAGVNIYFGGHNTVAISYPQEIAIVMEPLKNEDGTVSGTQQEARSYVDKLIKEEKISDAQVTDYTYQFEFIKKVEGNRLETYTGMEDTYGTMDSYTKGAISVISASDYKKLTGKEADLSGRQILLYSQGMNYQTDKDLILNGKTYVIKQVLDHDITKKKLPRSMSFIMDKDTLIVVADGVEVLPVEKSHYYFGIDTSLSADEQSKLGEKWRYMDGNDNTENKEITFNHFYASTRIDMERDFFAFTGSFLFIGLLLTSVFFMAAVLVIYYKQVSEGYEDKERFAIMQKVGLDQEATKKSIGKQMLTVFFLPIAVAFIHLAFAFKMLSLILRLLSLLDTSFIFQVTLVTCLIYFVLYVLVYLGTSHAYHKIIGK
ncbi:FtsX-like permease family protein [Streptococcus gallinaceus]|uniref:ABC transport system permease protein n=1 Tax=Streptococcus gallinaceus TaxID=165758 RepID=A0ABV2JHR9_9STRE|nr:ABC transporter permease [Streptococcus gallinaceus]MCP1640167.1 putative ABC transport system permease protein [Streptococcus gallinaceus]MCP1770949.1 putative ABC transport system permease protein [Streptococcus gallinaceus]